MCFFDIQMDQIQCFPCQQEDQLVKTWTSSVWHNLLLKYMLCFISFLFFLSIFSYVSFNTYKPCIGLRYDQWIQLLMLSFCFILSIGTVFAIYVLSSLSDRVLAIYSKSLLLDSISHATSSNILVILMYYLCPTLQMSTFRSFNFTAISG